MKGWESEMGDEFERRVRDLHESPHDLSSVKGRAMDIRRKRLATIAGVILAAVVVPVAIIATNSANDGADSIAPAGVDGSVDVLVGPVDGTEVLNPFLITGGRQG